MTIQKVLVFLGAKLPSDESYSQAVKELGEGLARRGLTLVFGGSNTGTMTILAEAVLQNGGQAVGVTTTALAKVLHPSLTQGIVTDSLPERKTTMYDLADAIIAMPGSLGTFDELFDALERVKIDKSHRRPVKPMAVLNLHGFYDGVLELIRRSIQEGYSKPRIANLLYSAQSVAELFDWLEKQGN